MRQIAVVTLAGAALALAGCADPQSPAPQGGSTASPTNSTALSPPEFAHLQAFTMLRSFTPPPGARRVSVSPSARLDHVEESTTAIDKNLVDASAEWVAPGKPADVLAEAVKHVPAQYNRIGAGTSGSGTADDVYQLGPVPNELNLRELDISVVSVGNGSTGIRVDALAGWVTFPPAQAHQWVPLTARVMTFTEFLKPKPVSAMRAPAMVTNPAQVADIVSLINSLAPLPQGAIYNCPADLGGGEVLLTFRARVGGPALAVVGLPQSGCAFASVAQNGKQETSLLPGDSATDVLWRIGRISGLDWATVQP